MLLVLITDEDYRELFQAKSSLETDRVKELITAATDAGASVVGVDLDTSDWNPAFAKDLRSAPVVWSRGAEQQQEKLKLDRILGRGAVDVCYGVPGFVPDEDGLVRSYADNMKDVEGSPVASFTSAIVQSYGHRILRSPTST